MCPAGTSCVSLSMPASVPLWLLALPTASMLLPSGVVWKPSWTPGAVEAPPADAAVSADVKAVDAFGSAADEVIG